MICSVPSRCWEIAKERTSSSVITPPALRITCASPIESPRIGYGFRRASMQATIATFLAGGSGRSPLSKPSAKASLFFRNWSMALISASLRTRFRRYMLNAIEFRSLRGNTRGPRTRSRDLVGAIDADGGAMSPLLLRTTDMRLDSRRGPSLCLAEARASRVRSEALWARPCQGDRPARPGPPERTGARHRGPAGLLDHPG